MARFPAAPDPPDLPGPPGPPEMAPVRDLLVAYAGALRRLLGDALTGVYVCGSLALGDYRQGASDLDVTVLLAGDPTAAQRQALAALPAGPVAALPGAERLDVSFVPSRLVGGYGDPALPFYRDGRFRDAGGGDVNPVLWHTLHRRGLTVWGPPAAAAVPEVDGAALRASM